LHALLGYNGRGVALVDTRRRMAAHKLLGVPDSGEIPATRIRPIPGHAFREPIANLVMQWHRMMDVLAAGRPSDRSRRMPLRLVPELNRRTSRRPQRTSQALSVAPGAKGAGTRSREHRTLAIPNGVRTKVRTSGPVTSTRSIEPEISFSAGGAHLRGS
jgi:hypothetical protein